MADERRPAGRRSSLTSRSLPCPRRAHSSSGLGRRPLTAVARVRIPYAPPHKALLLRDFLLNAVHRNAHVTGTPELKMLFVGPLAEAAAYLIGAFGSLFMDGKRSSPGFRSSHCHDRCVSRLCLASTYG